MLTLTQVATLDDWSVLTRELAETGQSKLVWPFMLAWVLFGALGIMNLITAAFVRSVLNSSKEGQEEAVQVKVAKRQALLLDIIEVFHAYDANDSGTLGMEELRMLMTMFESEEIQSRFEEVGMDLDDMQGAIMYSDADGSGEIDYEEFLNAVTKFDTEATKCDTLELQSRIRVLIHHSAAQHKELLGRLEGIASAYRAGGLRDRMERKAEAFQIQYQNARAAAGISLSTS